MPCEYAQEQLYLYLDGELAPDEARAVEHHLQGCASCRQEVTAHRRLQAMLRAACEEEEMPAQLWPAIRQQLAQEAGDAGMACWRIETSTAAWRSDTRPHTISPSFQSTAVYPLWCCT